MRKGFIVDKITRKISVYFFKGILYGLRVWEKLDRVESSHGVMSSTWVHAKMARALVTSDARRRK